MIPVPLAFASKESEMSRLLFQKDNKTMLWEPSLYHVDWLNSCEHCQCSKGIEVTSRSLSGTYFYAGDSVKCLQCGNQGVIDADGDGAWVDWDTEWED